MRGAAQSDDLYQDVSCIFLLRSSTSESKLPSHARRVACLALADVGFVRPMRQGLLRQSLLNEIGVAGSWRSDDDDTMRNRDDDPCF